MAVYRIVFTKQAYKALRKMPATTAARIRERLNRLAEDPHAAHPNVIKLQNRPGYRMRVGDWRVIYEIQDEELLVLVLKVASRGAIYR